MQIHQQSEAETRAEADGTARRPNITGPLTVHEGYPLNAFGALLQTLDGMFKSDDDHLRMSFFPVYADDHANVTITPEKRNAHLSAFARFLRETCLHISLSYSDVLFAETRWHGFTHSAEILINIDIDLLEHFDICAENNYLHHSSWVLVMNSLCREIAWAYACSFKGEVPREAGGR
ncbi:hypothetical protein BV25DRAFT_1825947 [Artomyces pyxidatus]|uniref:Uncharacterized protein n=1 Tax=Artomyces pyxidatus TaxID=48021 RepID=A0ACB8T140_9AGAM|nr:hypothetical protein BV25DRAFT_1825947 [Artomyces pyxidatus]